MGNKEQAIFILTLIMTFLLFLVLGVLVYNEQTLDERVGAILSEYYQGEGFIIIK